MEAVYQLGNLRVVDLTKVLDPATESRRCHLIRYNTGGPIPDYHTALDLTSHLGTHCECPYHHFEDGKSVGDLPLTTFMGRAIYVNIDFLEPNTHISAADLDRACAIAFRKAILSFWTATGNSRPLPLQPTALRIRDCLSMQSLLGGSATIR